MKMIKLSQGFEAIVDDEDFERLNKFNWCYAKRGKHCVYATRTCKIKETRRKENFYMHRLVMNLEKHDKKNIDHINGNGLDNRKINLRLCTVSQNHQNKKNHCNKIGHKGVSFHKKTGKYHAKIMLNYKLHSLKYHDTPEQAALAYNEKAKELFGKFASLNIL